MNPKRTRYKYFWPKNEQEYFVVVVHGNRGPKVTLLDLVIIKADFRSTVGIELQSSSS